MISVQYALTALVVALIPGTGVLYTVNTALSNDWRRGIWAAFGCTLGIVPHLLACLLGVTAIMHLGAQVFSVLKWAGVAYMAYLAVKTWMSAGKTEYSSGEAMAGVPAIMGRGVLLNLLNPKLTLFFLSFLPQFVPAGTSSPTGVMLALSAFFMAVTFIVFAAYAVLAGALGDFVAKRKQVMKWVERSFALVFAGLAAKLAFGRE